LQKKFCEDRLGFIFIPYLDGNAVLRTVENNGNYANEYISASLSSRLLNNSLILNFKPQLWFYQTTGEYDEHQTTFQYEVSAGYYFGNFLVSAYCYSSDNLLVQQSMWSNHDKLKMSYGASIGWGNGTWTLRAKANNPLSNSWIGTRSYLNGKYFTSQQTQISRDNHQWFQFTATYTINYGKKIRKGDEISSSSEGNSAIMK
jgi:hypothetical protein